MPKQCTFPVETVGKSEFAPGLTDAATGKEISSFDLLQLNFWN